MDFDLILLRILFSGLISSILLGAFFLLRRWLFVKTRRIFWIILLLMPLLVFPVGGPIVLPESAPSWLLDLRLPDPSTWVATPENIEQYLNEHYEGIKIDDHSIVSFLKDVGYQPELQLPDRLNLAMPVIRIIYLAGIVLFILLATITGIKRLKRWDARQRASAAALNREAWQSELAVVRDRLGIYRQAEIALADADDNHPMTILYTWRRRIISVPVADPADLPSADRQHWLEEQLVLIKKPQVPAAVFLMFIRSLVWFSPVWYLSGNRWQTDFLGGQVAKQKSVIKGMQITTSLLMMIILLVGFCLSAWQLPESIERDESWNIVSIQPDHDLMVSISNTTGGFEGKTQVSMIQIPSSNDFVLACTDGIEQSRWTLPLTEIWNAGEFEDFNKINLSCNSVQQDDTEWSILAHIFDYSSGSTQSGSTWHLRVSDDGRLISKRLLGTSSSSDEIIITERASRRNEKQFFLLKNGGYIVEQRSYSYQNLLSNQQTFISIDYLSCYSADDTLIRQLDQGKDELNNSALNLNVYSNDPGASGLSLANIPYQYFANEKDYLGVLFQQVFYSAPDKSDILNNRVLDVRFVYKCFKASGKIAWQKDLVSEGDHIYLDITSLQSDEWIYWRGFQLPADPREEASVNNALIGLNTSSSEMFRVFFDDTFNQFSITGTNSINGLLTLLFSGNNESTSSSLLICQIDAKGKMIGMKRMTNINDPYQYQVRTASPGMVELYQYMG